MGEEMAKSNSRTLEEKYDIIVDTFDSGGNGDVSLVRDKKTQEILVLKKLRNKTNEKVGRFVEEIEVMYNNYKKLEGIMPIYDYSKEEYWYVMPQAELLTKYISENHVSFDDRIDIIIEFASILNNLHAHGISHRDIKPLNLYILNGKYYFGDFGLASFPENKNDFTKSDKGLGAIFTIAPEMKRDPKHADGKKADVYSFAKTMWMILTLDEKGFDGQYNRDDLAMSLSQIEKYRELHLKELEDVISESTSNSPHQRPDMNQVLELLKNYKRIKADFDTAQCSDWKFLSEQIFGDNEPSSCSWESVDKILSVLNIIGKNPAYNHMFFSSMGGQEFHEARKANEDGCIEIYAGLKSPNIVKPKKLIFEGFGEDYTWNYFMLELDELPAQEPERWIHSEFEPLVEDHPAHYVSADYYQYGVYDYDSGERFPEGWQLVRRYKKGKFLITLTRGMYNAITATYDGRHAMCSSEEFKMYIKKMIETEHNLEKAGKDVRGGLNYIFGENPFKKDIVNDNNEKNVRKDGRRFIEENYDSWSFKVEKHNQPSDCKVRFRLTFNEQGGNHNLVKLFEKKKDVILSTEGSFKENITSRDILWIYDRKEALEIKKSIQTSIERICNLNGYDYPEFSTYLEIIMVPCGKPNHLFTCQELSKKLKEADDRDCNTVVINENGEVVILSNHWRELLYPVRNETFDAGNIYVGKYANVEAVAEELYPELLGRWRDYLRTGKTQYIDYYKYANSDLNEIEAEIKTYM